MSCGCNGRECGLPFDPDLEGPSASDIDRFGGDDIPCPECGADVYHDAAQCNACGHFMTDASQSGATSRTGFGKGPLVAMVASVLLVSWLVLTAVGVGPF